MKERLSPTERDRARHALGLPNSRRRSYRNRYFASPGGESHAIWSALVARGLADTSRAPRNDFFCLTRVGAEAALDDGETLDPEDFP